LSESLTDADPDRPRAEPRPRDRGRTSLFRTPVTAFEVTASLVRTSRRGRTVQTVPWAISSLWRYRALGDIGHARMLNGPRMLLHVGTVRSVGLDLQALRAGLRSVRDGPRPTSCRVRRSRHCRGTVASPGGASRQGPSCSSVRARACGCPFDEIGGRAGRAAPKWSVQNQTGRSRNGAGVMMTLANCAVAPVPEQCANPRLAGRRLGLTIFTQSGQPGRGRRWLAQPWDLGRCGWASALHRSGGSDPHPPAKTESHQRRGGQRVHNGQSSRLMCVGL
jgi:hypothetical protein